MHRRQLLLLSGGTRVGARWLSHRRAARRRKRGDHQAPRYGRSGVRGDGHRPAAVRDRRTVLPQPRRHRPLRHHTPGAARTRPGAGMGSAGGTAPGRRQGRAQLPGRLPQHGDLRAAGLGDRGEGAPGGGGTVEGDGRAGDLCRSRRAPGTLRPARPCQQRGRLRLSAGHREGPRRGQSREIVLPPGCGVGAGALSGLPADRSSHRRRSLRGVLAHHSARGRRAAEGGAGRRSGGGCGHRVGFHAGRTGAAPVSPRAAADRAAGAGPTG